MKCDPIEYYFYCTLIVVLRWPEDDRSWSKHVAKYHLILIIASCLIYVVYWRCIIYKHYTDLKGSCVWRRQKWSIFLCNLEGSDPELLLISLFRNPQGQGTRTKGMWWCHREAELTYPRPRPDVTSSCVSEPAFAPWQHPSGIHRPNGKLSQWDCRKVRASSSCCKIWGREYWARGESAACIFHHLCATFCCL